MSIFFDKSKNKWRARVPMGKRGHFSTAKTFPTQKEAREWYSQQLLKQKRLLSDNPDYEADIQEYAEAYIQNYKLKQKSKQHIEEITHVLRNSLKRDNIRFARDFRYKKGDTWLKERCEQNIIVLRTALKYAGILRKFGNWLKDELKLEINPLGNIWKPDTKDIEKDEDGLRDRAFSIEQLQLLLKKIEKRYPNRYGFFFALSKTGCRFSEMATIEYENFDLKNGLISIYKKKKYNFTPKSKRSTRIIPLDDELAKWIFENAPRSGLIFPSETGTLLQSNNISRQLKLVLKEPEFVKICPNSTDFYTHCFRHTWITHLLDAGCPLKMVSEWAGHSTIQVTEKYISRKANGDISKIEYDRAKAKLNQITKEIKKASNQ